MQRRAAGGPQPPGPNPSFSSTTSSTIAPPSAALGSSSSRGIRTAKSHATRPSNIIVRCCSILCSSPCLLFIASLLTIATWLSTPHDIQTFENEAMNAEKDVVNWWNQQNNGSDKQQDPSERMKSQSMVGKWVDGEKKLKNELKKLLELQKQGKELGVPVLTRWLGDDIPAWAGTGVDREEWNQKVAAAYERMKLEEEEWKQNVWNIINDGK